MTSMLPIASASRAGRLVARVAGVALLACVASTSCRADTVASLLGNFTVNQYCGVRIDEREVAVHYAVVFGQLPALAELHAADADGDGVTTEHERTAYARERAAEFSSRLALMIDGVAVPLRAMRWTTSLPAEQGGFSLRLDIDFSATLALADREIHAVEFANRNFAGRFGWQEIVVEPAHALAVFDTNAFSTSLTAGLVDAVQAMPASGPLAERSIKASVRRGALPPGSVALQPRPSTAAQVEAPRATPPSDRGTSWISGETRRLVALISAPSVPFGVGLLALLGAALLGALHALSPGHGKTIVGAYLIGSRATARHAAALGATVTITHTIGVFALGFATLFASRYVMPERLLPMLSVVSGLLVVGIGAALFTDRWHGVHDTVASAAHVRYRKLEAAHPGSGVALALAHARIAHRHHGDPDHAHIHSGIAHSHGGRVHTHRPPGAVGERVTWKSLLMLGVSGGLVPCPSAMVLLLAAVGLNKTGYGLLMVLAFSIGLAGTLTAVGVVFLYGRQRVAIRSLSVRALRWLPLGSAAAITLVGVGMCCGAIAGWPQ